MTNQAETGYALVTAVVAMALFALFALALQISARGAFAGTDASAVRSRLAAAAEAGTMLAIHGLAETDARQRWPMDGRPRRLQFEQIDLEITVEDESAKIPINAIDERQARAMFAAAGAGSEIRDRLADAFLDWRDGDEDRRPFGAEAADYTGVQPRNGGLHRVDELLSIQGMTPAVFERLRPAVSVHGGRFDDRHAGPLALAVMSGGRRGGAVVAYDDSLAGRVLHVRVLARSPRGRLASDAIVEFTGSESRPWVIRQYD